jgi:hypothetical protein
MIYQTWGENELSKKEIKIITITETIFTNCSTQIPNMHVIDETT